MEQTVLIVISSLNQFMEDTIVAGTMVDYREVVNPLEFNTIMEATARVEAINMVVVLEYSYYL